MSRRRSLVRKPSTLINLSTLHPVDIFGLWQVYLENFDPLFKVTHNPSLQRRFEAAARSLTSNGPSLEALMFSIYCMCLPTFSLTEEDCLAMFGLTKDDLQTQYQFGSQQALVNAGLLILELGWWCETGLLGRY
ncbi:hypothetical protein Purlil1_7107 [Purpureocillium lilacinum]|uniref:Transcription factor domain-containing protein n=1 Tax=Purpureocillium lilacinum TaxID=33203 RepID=A0ABR0BWV6_PURLI|nr:hypothetical protein Purlil1_7107 [Purpureocillium lilacinum]